MPIGQNTKPLQSLLGLALYHFGDTGQSTSQIPVAMNPVIDTSVTIDKLASDSGRLASQLLFGSNGYELHMQDLLMPKVWHGH